MNKANENILELINIIIEQEKLKDKEACKYCINYPYKNKLKCELCKKSLYNFNEKIRKEYEDKYLVKEEILQFETNTKQELKQINELNELKMV